MNENRTSKEQLAVLRYRRANLLDQRSSVAFEIAEVRREIREREKEHVARRNKN